MKHLLFLFLFFSMLPAVCAAQDRNEECINLHYKGHHGTHYNLPAPADEPDAFYNSSTQTVIIDGDGYVTYYDVEIAPLSTWIVAISTQVNGYYDTIMGMWLSLVEHNMKSRQAEKCGWMMALKLNWAPNLWSSRHVSNINLLTLIKM